MCWPPSKIYKFLFIFSGTLATLSICLYNLRYTNNVMQFQSAITIVATTCIFCYRVATSALHSPFHGIKSWDTVHIINVFWGLLIAQFVFEILTFAGIFKSCGVQLEPTKMSSNKFVYHKPKEKTEDYIFDPVIEEPWNIDEVKLNLARSISHLMLNSMMLIVVLLMRPHNVIMVPSIYVTCLLTSKCMDHKLLDFKSAKRTDVADVLSRTLVHMWIGILFFFYQVCGQPCFNHSLFLLFYYTCLI